MELKYLFIGLVVLLSFVVFVQDIEITRQNEITNCEKINKRVEFNNELIYKLTGKDISYNEIGIPDKLDCSKL